MTPRFASILVSVTEVCHVGCAHCGFIGSPRDREPTREELARWVGQAASYGVPIVIFTGGEPFERFAALRDGVAAAHAGGSGAAVFTSSFWATSPTVTRETLVALPGLTELYLSSDIYHQRRVPYTNVYNVIEAAGELGIADITICITYDTEAERDEVRGHYAAYTDRVRFHVDRVIPNPHGPARIHRRLSSLNAPRADDFKCSCWLGTPIVNPNGDVFTCHVGKAAAHLSLRELPYFLGNLHEQTFDEIMTAAGTRADYQYLRTHGPRGVASLVEEQPEILAAVGRDGFTSACDMCFAVLSTEPGRNALRQRAARPDVRDTIDIRLALLLGEHPLDDSTRPRAMPPSVI